MNGVPLENRICFSHSLQIFEKLERGREIHNYVFSINYKLCEFEAITIDAFMELSKVYEITYWL
jgi:hypothetical protein